MPATGFPPPSITRATSESGSAELDRPGLLVAARDLDLRRRSRHGVGGERDVEPVGRVATLRAGGERLRPSSGTQRPRGGGLSLVVGGDGGGRDASRARARGKRHALVGDRSAAPIGHPNDDRFRQGSARGTGLVVPAEGLDLGGNTLVGQADAIAAAEVEQGCRGYRDEGSTPTTKVGHAGTG